MRSGHRKRIDTYLLRDTDTKAQALPLALFKPALATLQASCGTALASASNATPAFPGLRGSCVPDGVAKRCCGWSREAVEAPHGGNARSCLLILPARIFSAKQSALGAREMKTDWATISVTAYGSLLVYAFVDQMTGGASFLKLVEDFQTLIAGGFALVSVLYLARQVREERLRHVAGVALALKPELEAIELVLEWIDVDRVNNPRLATSVFNRPVNPWLCMITEEEMAFAKENVDLRVTRHIGALRNDIDAHNKFVSEPANMMYPDMAAPKAKELADKARDTARTIRHMLIARQSALNALIK